MLKVNELMNSTQHYWVALGVSDWCHKSRNSRKSCAASVRSSTGMAPSSAEKPFSIYSVNYMNTQWTEFWWVKWMTILIKWSCHPFGCSINDPLHQQNNTFQVALTIKKLYLAFMLLRSLKNVLLRHRQAPCKVNFPLKMQVYFLFVWKI